MLSGPTTEKYSPRWSERVLLRRVEEDAALPVAGERVVLVRVPQRLRDLDVLGARP